MTERTSLDTLCGALAAAMGIAAPEQAAAPNTALTDYVEKTIGRADRLFMYNPDAVAQWVYEKYPQLLAEAKKRTELELPFCTVMPSVTPVCFGTMYTGAQPEVHGIRSYTKPMITIDTIFDSLIRAGRKPVIRIDTLFDALLRAGKKPAIVCTAGDSLSKIYLERDMDYFFYPTVEEVNAKAAQLILEDKHDAIVVYNGNYDAVMHRWGPESVEALGELRANSEMFAMFNAMIEENWKQHNTLVGFAMDHGCHEIDGSLGSHGLDMEEDLHIVHLYKTYPAEK